MSLLFIEKVKTNRAAFERKVRAIANKHNFNPDWLMAVINNETAGTFSPSIRNAAGSGATGLIQFMPTTARDLGTTTDALAAMSNVAQLDYVDAYIVSIKGYFRITEIADYDDLYFIVFYPAAIGKPDGWAFPGTIYSQNKGVDVDRNGVITVSDFKTFIRKHVPAGYEFTTFLGQDARKKAIFLFVLVAVVTLAYAGYLLMKKD